MYNISVVYPYIVLHLYAELSTISTCSQTLRLDRREDLLRGRFSGGQYRYVHYSQVHYDRYPQA